jgi:AcrR family transcriptional regulator
MNPQTRRRTPQQERSKAKVSAILDGADEIVFTNGVEALTTTLVAKQAGIAVGSLYQYFDGVDDIIAALAERHAERFASRLSEKLAGVELNRKSDAANAALDLVITYYRTEPTFRALWRGAPQLHGAGFGDASAMIIQLVLDTIIRQGLADADDPVFQLEAQVQWKVAEGLIGLAFERDPDGDPAVLAHLRRLFDLDVLPVGVEPPPAS